MGGASFTDLDVFHVSSRDFDHVSTFCQRDVVAASCSSEQNVLYARIFVKSVDVTKQCIVFLNTFYMYLLLLLSLQGARLVP